MLEVVAMLMLLIVSDPSVVVAAVVAVVVVWYDLDARRIEWRICQGLHYTNGKFVLGYKNGESDTS